MIKYDVTSEMVEELENRFLFHHVKPGQAVRYEKMQALCVEMGLHILATTPKSREQSLALTKLDEVLYYANAAIARNEK